MPYLAIAELVVIVVLIWLRDRERIKNNEVIVDLTKLGIEERQQLITRIQHPERVPPLHTQARAPAPKPHPNLAKIGTFAPPGKRD
jgi:hypothetical protein